MDNETQTSNIRPKKSLGQNFLTSIPARNAIINAGNLTPKDIVFEIGPGKGMLTSGLLATGAKVVALEKDRELIPYLKEKFAAEIANGCLILIEGDVLLFDLTTVPSLTGNYKLIANIPYYITGAILSKYLTAEHPPTDMVVLVQKEVAERVVARDGKHSLLSLSVHAFGVPKIVYRVSRGSFNPIPNVDSAVLYISSISKQYFSNKAHEERFFEILHSGFAHKRKFLIRNLETLAAPSTLESVFSENGISLKARAEDLELSSWITLSRLL